DVGPPVRSVASISRSGDPKRSHWLLLRSLMPELSVTTTGSWTPATEPGAIVVRLPKSVTASSVFSPLGPARSVHVALVPPVVSTTEFAFGPEHAAGPAFVAAPQSLSANRIDAFGATPMVQAPQPWSTKSN